MAERIASPREFDLWQGGLEPNLDNAGIALFSLKESVFKCLHASIGRYFDFRDVEVFRTDSALRVRATDSDSALADPLSRVRGDVCELGGKVLSGCILLGR